MRIAIVDDDPQLLTQLQQMLSSALDSLGVETEFIKTFDGSPAFRSSWEPGCYDLILLDIYMGQENGVELARYIRQKDEQVLLVFCTSSNEFASESYEVGAGYYLQKPLTQRALTAMVQRLHLSRVKRNRTVRLPDGYQLLLRQILYTEYSNHTVTFHLQDTAPHSLYMSHAEAEALLLHYHSFCCINKGCIVNLAMVSKITGSEFQIKNGQLLPIARRRYKEVYEAYTKFRFARMAEEVSD